MTNTEQQVQAVLDAAVAAWEDGETTSPSADDFVTLAEQLVGYEMSEDERGAFYEYQCEGHDTAELATWLVECLSVPQG